MACVYAIVDSFLLKTCSLSVTFMYSWKISHLIHATQLCLRTYQSLHKRYISLHQAASVYIHSISCLQSNSSIQLDLGWNRRMKLVAGWTKISFLVTEAVLVPTVSKLITCILQFLLPNLNKICCLKAWQLYSTYTTNLIF